MFERIKSFFRKGAISVLGTPDLFAALEIDVPYSQTMQDAIKLWAQMHENKAPWLYGDKCYRNLGLPSLIAHEISRLATIEVKAELTGGRLANFLNVPFQSLISCLPVSTEFACARGDMVFKPYINGNRIAINRVKAGEHFSLAFDSDGYSTSELFLDWHVEDEKLYVRGEIQEFTGDSMRITNKVVVTPVGQESYRPTTLDRVERWRGLAESAQLINVTAPAWGHYKMPFANTVDDCSPAGVSVYANSSSQIEDADEEYTILKWEMSSGKRKLFTDETVRRWDARGFSLPLDDEFTIGLDAGNEQLFYDYSAPFRDASIINALTFVLGRVESNSGLSQGAISQILKGQARTATEVLALEQETRATVSSVQAACETALRQTVYAMEVWARAANLAPTGAVEASIEFGDGVVLGEDEEYKRLNEQAASGRLKDEYVLAHMFKLPTATDEDLLEIRRKYMPDLSSVPDKGNDEE